VVRKKVQRLGRDMIRGGKGRKREARLTKGGRTREWEKGGAGEEAGGVFSRGEAIDQKSRGDAATGGGEGKLKLFGTTLRRGMGIKKKGRTDEITLRLPRQCQGGSLDSEERDRREKGHREKEGKEKIFFRDL